MDREKWSTKQTDLFNAMKSLRLKEGFTQTQLAEKLQRPQSYISKYEKGERRLDLIEINEICKACNTTLVEFVSALNYLNT